MSKPLTLPRIHDREPGATPAAPALSPELRSAIVADVAARYEERISALESEVKRLAPRTVSNKATVVVFSGDMDKVLAALVIATGAAAMGMEVSMFHTFWGLMPLRKARMNEGKTFIEKAMGWMTPAGMGELNPSQMSYAGVGAKLFRSRMKTNGIQSPEEFFALAREMGVKFVACGMSMDVMGLKASELVDGIEVGGVAAYLGDAADSKVTLFI